MHIVDRYVNKCKNNHAKSNKLEVFSTVLFWLLLVRYISLIISWNCKKSFFDGDLGDFFYCWFWLAGKSSKFCAFLGELLSFCWLKSMSMRMSSLLAWTCFSQKKSKLFGCEFFNLLMPLLLLNLLSLTSLYFNTLSFRP